MTRVLPVTPEGKRYEKTYYSDRKGSSGVGGGRRGREEMERPTTSGHTTSLRERHGFSPVRQLQARPSTAAPTTSNRENLAMYLQRMERILAEVQATHTDLISRRIKRKGRQERVGSEESGRSPPRPSHRQQPPAQVETVPLDIDEILADASIESASPSPVRTPPRRLRAFLGSPNKTHRSPISLSRLRRTPDRRKDVTPERNMNENNNRNETSAHIARPGTASRRSSALRKLRKVSARNRSVRQNHAAETTHRKQQEKRRINATKKKVESPEHEGVIAVTSSTFCLKPGQLQDRQAWNRSYSQSPEEAVRQTAANMAGVLLKDENKEGSPDELDSESVRQAVLEKLEGMGASLRASLAANFKRALVRRRLNSKLGRSVVADIKHLVELIDGCSDENSSSSLQNMQLEQKMKVQFIKDLALKKQELAKLVSTSQALAPRVLKKPSVPVTPLKRISKSLRIRNRPGTAPVGGSRNTTKKADFSENDHSSAGNKALGQRRTAWGESERSAGDMEHPAKKEEVKQSRGRTTTQSKSSGSLAKGKSQGLNKTDTTSDGPKKGDSEEEGSSSKGQEEKDKKKAFLKRKRQKVKMYKIPNYSHVKSVVDSRHNDEHDDQAQDTYMYTQARPSTAPPMQTQQEKTPLAAQQNDSPIDDLKKILGLKQKNSHGKENALPRSSSTRKGGRRWKGKSVSSSTHLNISGTVARLFSSSVQKAKESILLFEQTDIDADNENSQVPRAVQKLQFREEQMQSDTTSVDEGGASEAKREDRGGKYQYGVQYNLRKLVEQPEILEKIKSETKNLEDFVKPRELSFVHLNMTKD